MEWLKRNNTKKKEIGKIIREIIESKTMHSSRKRNMAKEKYIWIIKNIAWIIKGSEEKT